MFRPFKMAHDTEVPIIDYSKIVEPEDKSIKSRSFCFTAFDCSIDKVFELLITHGAQYIICGEEIAPTTGKLHLQSFVYYKNARSWSAVRKALKGIKSNIEVCKGSVEQNYIYCSKDKKYREYGEKPSPGKRNDIKSITDSIKEGKSTKEIVETYGDKSLRITHHIDKVRGILKSEKRNWEMDVRIYIGPPGSGKSRSVWEEFGVDNVYPKMVGKWWDHYNYETCVLIDDFDPYNIFDITFDFYLKLLDRYPMFVEYKGGSTNFCSKTIIFTSNTNIDEWFQEKSNRSAFFRRVKSIRYFGAVTHDTEVGVGNTSATPTAPASPNIPTFVGIK